MSDIVHEMTLYAKRDPEPYVRWAGKVIELKQRISELESVNADLYEALDLMLQRYGYETCEYVQKSQTALAKARGEQ